jgi:ABC-type multidrug transport system fused ATPase/permease subunit
MAVFCGLIVIFFFRYVSSFSKNISRKSSKESSTLQKFLVQTFHSIKYLKSTSRFEHFINDINSSIKKLTTYSFKLSVADAFTQSIREPFTVFLIIIIILVQVLVMEQSITPILVTLLLFYRSLNTIMMAQFSWQQLMNKVGGLEMVEDEFKFVKGKKEPKGNIKLKRFENKVEFKNMSFSYDNNEAVLSNINIVIKKNQTIGIVGESGAGKSTLIDLLTLLIRPKKGEIFFDDIASKDIESTSWRSKLGIVPQETIIFDDSVANNISLRNADFGTTEGNSKIIEAAKKAYCDSFINDLPQGYMTRVGDKGVRLSGGQRQRISIARELFKDPDLLILDEATSALDTESERYIQQSIDDLKGKVTVVIIAHRLSTIKNVDSIYVMDKGKVIESGTFKELVNKEGSKFQKMVSLQSLN